MADFINPIWVQEVQIEDLSITSYEFHEYKEINVNVKDLTKFDLQTRNLDMFYHPNESYITVKWKLVKEDGSNIAAEYVTHCNNICNQYITAELFLNNTSITKIDHVGYKTLIESLINFSDDYSKSAAAKMFWYPDTADSTDISKFKYFGNITEIKTAEDAKKFVEAINDNSNYNQGFHKRMKLTKDSQTVCSDIPLSNLFGFCKWYNKSIRGVNIRIVLYLNNMSNIIHQADNGEYKIVIEDIGLWVPQLDPSKMAEARIERQILSNPVFRFSWDESNIFLATHRNEISSTWRVTTEQHRPTHIYVMFQKSSHMDNVKQTNMIFHHMNLESLQVRVNGKQYPDEELKNNFDGNDYLRAYNNFLLAGNKTNNEDSGTIVNPKYFKKLYSILHIDVSKYPDTLYSKAQTADVVIKYRFDKAPTENYNIICMITHERNLTLNPVTLREHVIS